jgi:undecaprenyl diphosphate synthase
MTDTNTGNQRDIRPIHVAIVMDGNGRWANCRGLKRHIGHQAGITSVKAMVKSCLDHGINYLSLFAFGQDNWKRPKEETSFLMHLFMRSLNSEYQKLHQLGVKIDFIGDLSAFPSDLIGVIDQAKTLTKNNTKLTISIAVNYSGQWDILQAVHKFTKHHGNPPDSIDQLTQHLVTAQTPDPDLFIRTSGEQRISNYMLWQLAYTELYFTKTYWPDFDEHAFTQALAWFAQRKRRFGYAHDRVSVA